MRSPKAQRLHFEAGGLDSSVELDRLNSTFRLKFLHEMARSIESVGELA
jgi:hypothetical protein